MSAATSAPTSPPPTLPAVDAPSSPLPAVAELPTVATAAAMSPQSNDPGRMYLPRHIIVLVHGNNGAPADFDGVERTLLRKFGAAQVLVIKSAANHTQTSLGVETGGQRLAEEVYRVLFEYELHPDVDAYKLSIVAHSLGGLYSRFAIASLIDSLAPLNIEYMSFVTICTPHLGSRRARGESALKNVWRMGVHTVLKSRTIYGQTGIDLLVDSKKTTEIDSGTDSAELSPPLLEVMSKPQSEFIKALQHFRYGTLVAMTDGDVVVPYPSASIRNFNPYPSSTLTERFPEWRWHVHHSGFEGSQSGEQVSEFLQKLNDKVDPTIQLDQMSVGLDVSAGPRYPSVDGYDADNKQEVEFSYDMILSLQQAMPWRRIDVTVEPFGVKGKLRLHDWPLCKMQPPGCRAEEFIDLLCDMLGHDHEMQQLPPLTEETLRVTNVTVTVQHGSDEESVRGSFVNNGFGRIMEKFQQKRSESGQPTLSQESNGDVLMSPSPMFRRSSSLSDEPRSSFVNSAGFGRFFDKFQKKDPSVSLSPSSTPGTSAQTSPSSSTSGKPKTMFGAGFGQLLDRFQKKPTTPSSVATASDSPLAPNAPPPPPPHPGLPQAATSQLPSQTPNGGIALELQSDARPSG